MRRPTKACPFCESRVRFVDYKDERTLGRFITDHGKILPSRLSGVCARHQRQLSTAIKRARYLALLPYTRGLRADMSERRDPGAVRAWVGEAPPRARGVPDHPHRTRRCARCCRSRTRSSSSLPALAACCLVGWWAGGRLVARRRLGRGRRVDRSCNPRRRARSSTSCAAGVCCSPARSAWSACSGRGRPFFSRALGAAAMALTLVLLMSSRGPLTPARAPARRAGGVRASQRGDAGDVPHVRSSSIPRS